MKRHLFITLLLVLCVMNVYADDVTGETVPAAGGTYYIYNVGQGKYLNVSGNSLVLDDTGVQFTVAQNTNNSSYYTLTANNAVFTVFNGSIICTTPSASFYTDEVKLLTVSTTDDSSADTDVTYRIGFAETENMYAYTHLYYNSRKKCVSKSALMTQSDDGIWKFMEEKSSGEKVTSVSLSDDITYSKPGNLASSVTVNLSLSNSRLAAGSKNTICLPFEMTADQVESAFGESTKLYEFHQTSGDRVYFKHKTTNEIEAGVPYIIIPSSVSSDGTYTIEDVSKSSFISEPESCSHNDYTFYGIFSKTTIEDVFYTWEGNSFVKYDAAADNSLYGFKAYIQANTSDAKALIFAIECESTDIEDMDAEAASSLTIYNISGQLIRENAKGTNGLAKGIYIVNGQKMIIR